MRLTDFLLLLALVFAAGGCLLSLAALLRLSALSRRQAEELAGLRRELADQLRENRSETTHTTQTAVASLGQALAESQRSAAEMQSKVISDLNEQFTLRSEALQKTVNQQLARVEGRLEGADCEALASGMVLGDGSQCLPALLEPLGRGDECRLTLREGKYHQVKRMLAARGKPVVFLRRLSMGPLSLGEELKEGEWRLLTEEEAAALQRIRSGS